MSDQVKITVIATGFDQEAHLRSRLNLISSNIEQNVEALDTKIEKNSADTDSKKVIEADVKKGPLDDDIYDIPAFLRSK